MSNTKFLVVGENIHCTRIYKVGGKYVKAGPDGAFTIGYTVNGEARQLPIPPHFEQTGDWAAGKVKHCAVAIWQGVYGDAEGQALGKEYIESVAIAQEKADAAYLDINVDEFSTDIEERKRLMKWAVGVAQGVTSIPMSIDSSNADILRAGLEACDSSRGRPMVNSVSLERVECIATAAEFNAVVIASAAGEKDLPATTEERLANLARLVEKLDAVGLRGDALHFDPLVFTISTDGANGKSFLDAVAGVRQTYGPEVHIVGGLSNVSFGMPNRKLINQVFAYLAVEAGADGGIVDPKQINGKVLDGVDTSSEGFALAKALLLGEDDFGMNFITAVRAGTI